jgi:PAS domain S-box-containing protein
MEVVMAKKPTYEELEKEVLRIREKEDSFTENDSPLRIMFEQSRDGLVVIDQTGKVHEANKRFADMLGYSMEEIHQLHVWDWDTQFNKEQLLEMLRSVDYSGEHFETYQRRKDGTILDIELSANGFVFRKQKFAFCICRDITSRKQLEIERKNLIFELKEALAQVKTLGGLLPICMHCKKIRDDSGYWNQVEAYIAKHSDAQFSHSICEACLEKYYPEED